MNTPTRLIAPLLTLVFLIAVFGSFPVGAQGWNLEDALKQIDKATKGIKGVTAEVELSDVKGGEETTASSGKVSVSFQGKSRFEMSDDDSTTILCTPSVMYIHRPSQMTVEQFQLPQHPEKLAQYTLLGFQPTGQAMKKNFLVTMLEEDSLDGKRVVLLELTPKKENLRAVIGKIHLWIDQSNWLPTQQRIYHGASETYLTVRYGNVARNDSLNEAIFKPNWPKGTKKTKG
jgi:outer membrane lipoprotein-sorting protein